MGLKGNMYYQNGFKYKALVDITKKDIITLCKILNSLDYYKDLCTFEPEAIREGGIVYKFLNDDKVKGECVICKTECDRKKYKSIRLCLGYDNNKDEWGCVRSNVMEEWENDDDIIISNHSKIETFLKSFHGAPFFTREEITVVDDAFKKIGLVRMFKTK